MRNAVFQVLLANGSEAQGTVKVQQVILGADRDAVATKKFKCFLNGFLHQEAAQLPVAECRRYQHAANAGTVVADAGGQQAGIGSQLPVLPAAEMPAAGVLSIGILVNTILFHHKYFIAQLHNSIQLCCAECVE